MVRSRAVAIAVFVASCSSEPVLIAPPWDGDRQVALFLVDDDLRTVDGPRVVLSDEAASFSFDESVGRRVLALAYPSVADGFYDLTKCGVVETTEASQTIVSAQQAWLSSPVRDDGTFDFSPSDVRRSLGLVRCDPDPCPSVQTEIWPVGLVGGGARGVAVLDDGDVVVAITDREKENSWLVRMRDGEDVWRIELDGAVARSVAWDGDRTLYTFVDAVLTAFDLDGNPATPLRAVPVGNRVASDGRGNLAAATADGLLSLNGTWPDVDGSFEQLTLVPGAGLAFGALGVWRFDGATWSLDLPDVPYNRLAGDETVLLAFNEVGGFIAYRDAEWRELDLPETYVRMAAGTGRGGGRLVLAGDDGKVALETPKGWCALEPQVGQRFVYAVATEGGRVVTLGAELRNTPNEDPVVMRIRIDD